MPETPDVIPGEPVESAWGNDIRDRTLQRYADGTERDLLNPIPVAGDGAFLEASGQWEVFADGSWGAIVAADFGSSDAPSLTFSGDDNTGWYRFSPNIVGFTGGGTSGWLISQAFLRGDKGTGSARIISDPGSAASPNYAFEGGPGPATGMFYSTFPFLGLTVNGTQVAEFRATSTFFPVAGQSTIATAPNAFLRESDGFLARSTAVLAAMQPADVVALDARTGVDTADLRALVDHLLDRIDALEALH